MQRRKDIFQNYYYGSEQWTGRRRGKRSTDQLEELRRMKRDIDANGLNMNDWYRDMTEMDQDSCGKKLICELRSKEASGARMTVNQIVKRTLSNIKNTCYRQKKS